ncbi:MAG TPA: hypothetical protein VFE36_07400 [Candidatus Baltobacteraceae bacterium]|nr:hypothetical protein [Candidatus Baltobacteraceae bacterium]
MRLSFFLTMSVAVFMIPFIAYEAGVPADDDLSQRYVQTVSGVRDHVKSFDAQNSIRYETTEIGRTIRVGTSEVAVWIRQHV